ncbi:MAG: hypothetical protein J6X83_04335 [Methanomicrobium sp.]|nr:hypothetical protein [Methanomicrobium sp.]
MINAFGDYISDQFLNLVKIVVGSFFAIFISCGIMGFIVICYVVVDDMKKRRKKR